jgi:hypothetical protein
LRKVVRAESATRETKESPLSDSSLFGEVQMVLAEKRTALSTVRTGIAVLALPLSVLGLLVATSKYYEPTRVLQFLLPLLGLSALLALFGAYLIIHSMKCIHRYDRMLNSIKRQHSALAEFM